MKILKKKYDLSKDEPKSIPNQNEALKKEHITLVKEVSDTTLDEHEMVFQEFLINGFDITKHASMIY